MKQKKGPVFIDKTLQHAFDKYGYACFRLLNEEQADKLISGYTSFAQKHQDIPISFVSTSHSNDAELISKVNDLILSVAKDEIKNHLIDYEILFSNFLLKKAVDQSESDPHQDVTLVDESKFLSFSIWIALTNTSPANGCLRMLNYSHKMPGGIRPNPSYPWRYRDVIPHIQSSLIDYPMKKGEAILFAHSTIHASYPNLSGVDRLAAVIALYPNEAETFHYQLPKKDASVVHKYKMDREAFISYVKGAPPSLGQLVGKEDFSSKAISSWQYYWERFKAALPD